MSLKQEPIENIIASKLVRMEPKDFDDITYLMQHFRTPKNAIRKVVEGFPAFARERAEENLVYLDVFVGDPNKPAKTLRKKRGRPS